MDLRNLKKLARALNLRRVRVNAGNLVTSCPFASETHRRGTDRKPSFGILIDDEGESVYHCFGCDERGDLLTLCRELSDLHGEDYGDLEEWVLQNEDVGTGRAISRSETDPDIWRKNIDKKLEEEAYDESEYDQFRVGPPPYAFERGLTKEVCRIWEIGDDPEDQRMMFPVRRMKDRRLVGIKGRTYADAKNKYIPYLPWSQSSFFFGEHMIRDSKKEERIVVVEGELDAIKVWMAGFTGLALMASSVSVEQKRKLELLSRPLILLPDRDIAGRRWANSLGKAMSDMMSVRDARVPEGFKDAGDLELEQIREVVEKARLRL